MPGLFDKSTMFLLHIGNIIIGKEVSRFVVLFAVVFSAAFVVYIVVVVVAGYALL